MKKDFNQISEMWGEDKAADTEPDGRRRKGIVRPTASPEEAAQREAELRTQGKKGCRTQKLNMSFTKENFEFLTTCPTLFGMRSTTQFMNFIVTAFREKHQDVFDMARSIKEKTRNLKNKGTME